ncbi:hemerythrin domain-containing protein [Odoribacter sp. OttesenSCG-928-J03]|nr:hemerythrin domain-containing protein [Odoribacter sp. OttesenSCG-928-J03]MDL2283188.1 hemerythrin domain-containing protein [Odoribacter sp. OttesenSCG-928-G04]
MSIQVKYSRNNKLSDLICSNYDLLLILSRFGIALGFGDQTVGEVCEKHKVDTDTFLAVVNFMENNYYPEDYYENNLSIETLVAFLQQAHAYFLNYNLPEIRKKLVDAIGNANNEISFLILKFYDEYVDEVQRHMEYENDVVFKYVASLLEGNRPHGYSISVFEDRHNHIAEKLGDLKNIIIKYYPSDTNNNNINNVLFDIFNCEKDLDIHCSVEDYIFVPLIKQFEEKK